MDYASAVGKAREGNETKRRGEKVVFPQLSFGLFGRDLETSRSPTAMTKNKGWLPADTSSREFEMGTEKNIQKLYASFSRSRRRGAAALS